MTGDLKARMKKRGDRFVVGYFGRGNIVFGREPLTPRSPEGWHWEDAAEPMTRLQAERFLKALPCKGAAIFELVPVKGR